MKNCFADLIPIMDDIITKSINFVNKYFVLLKCDKLIITTMFSLTTKSTYGMAAVLELAKHYGHGLLQIKDMTERKSLPQGYLEQLMNRLVKAGIVTAVRGKKGGYALAQDPGELTLLNVLEALEGPVKITRKGSHETAIEDVLLEIEENVRKALTIPLTEILARQADTATTGMFYI